MNSSSRNGCFRFLLFVFVVLLTEYTNTSISCIETERTALLMFKQGLNDPSGRLSSWVGVECCKWKGVGCSNQTGNVVKLDLGNSPDFYLQPCNKPFGSSLLACLGGEINPSLLNLTHLNYLNLKYNNFSGITIPSFIGSFMKLRFLDLSHSSFGGRVPTSLGNLSNLLYLDLTTFSDIYEKNLRTSSFAPTPLDLWVSDLNWLTNLNSLQYLGLGGARLDKVKSSWVQSVNMLPSLLELHVSLCGLTDLPHSLPSVHFTSLMVVDISHYKFINSSLPQWLFNISTLVSVKVSSNDLFGSISQIKCGNLCGLQTLELRDNFITGEVNELLDALSGCSNHSLQVLELSMNKLNGKLPDTFGSLKYLETLSLGDNSFSGPFPLSVVNLSRPSTLDLSANLVSGIIPESIGQLRELSILNLWDNLWQGVISESHLQNLTSLIRFSVSSKDKSLSFDIGHDWIPPSSLLFVAISDCQLGFPVWLRTQKEIPQLIITDNALLGDIPNWVWTFSSGMYWLDLSNNQLSGKLPQSINSNMFTVKLGSNHLEGALPVWATAAYLDLGSNKFSGSIPFNIGQMMPSMIFLDYPETI